MSQINDSFDHQSIQIVASDLDGTLLSPNHRLSDYAKQTLKALHQQGYNFIFATGRHHIDVAGIRQSVGIPAYMITSNGARVHDIEDNLMLAENIQPEMVQAIVNIMAEPHLMVHIYQDDIWWVSREDEHLRQYHADQDYSYQMFDSANAPTAGIAKIFVTHPEHDHDYLVGIETKLQQAFGDQLAIAFSTPWCLEVMASGVSKGHALDMVAQKLGFELNHCIAFGDGMNDVEMLSMAGKGLVMETAHNKVKAALPDNEVIGSNQHDAVAQYLEQHLLQR
ncbi:Cof-type HAD-IIB family hydrolase [Vibrio hippocampi]|uniref:Pyridoxal phosphate phosphatase YigL n=1 Tax=Vibrio hippocampi TaxID=654686 RepID=A0ABM8ZK87_9VIBR|nr:Cof-type HAD-IIB family hydrolase [Vibrio hippocampi]CAH0527373.1 Pyridoxal phosphate phosphatase YigL [Vibrio hippocampi]